MSKIITIDYTTDPPKISNNNVGEVGENRAVTLHCIPESIEGVALYVMYFTVEGGVMPSKTFDVSESIDIMLTEELTQQEEMECQLIGLSSLGEGAMVVAKSPIVHLWFGESIDGEVVTDPETGDTIFDQIQELKELAERIPNADEIPTEGSRNYVTSDGIFNTVISIEEDIPKNVSQLTNDADYVDGTRLNNKLLDYTLDAELSTVAKSGRYSDLKAVPDLSIYTIDSTLDKVAKSGLYGDLKNKPAFSDVALSGNYNDLANKPNLNVYAKSTDVAYTYQPKAEMNNYAKVNTLPNAYKDLNQYINTPQFVKLSELNTKLDKYALITDLNAYQTKLTSANAGTNITIENGVISATGGSDAKEPFYATYDVTPYEDVKQAIIDGRQVFLNYDTGNTATKYVALNYIGHNKGTEPYDVSADISGYIFRFSGLGGSITSEGGKYTAYYARLNSNGTYNSHSDEIVSGHGVVDYDPAGQYNPSDILTANGVGEAIEAALAEIGIAEESEF